VQHVNNLHCDRDGIEVDGNVSIKLVARK